MWGSMLNAEQYEQLKPFRNKLLRFKNESISELKPDEINKLNYFRGLWTTWGTKDLCCGGAVDGLLTDMIGLMQEYEEKHGEGK